VKQHRDWVEGLGVVDHEDIELDDLVFNEAGPFPAHVLELLDVDREEAVRVGLLPEVCRGCGCTEQDACVTATGRLLGGLVEPGDRPVCGWAAPGLCTSCAVGWVIAQPGACWTDLGAFLEGLQGVGGLAMKAPDFPGLFVRVVLWLLGYRVPRRAVIVEGNEWQGDNIRSCVVCGTDPETYLEPLTTEDLPGLGFVAIQRGRWR